MGVMLDALAQTVETTIAPFKAHASERQAEAQDLPPPPPNPARTVQQVGAAILGATTLVSELTNTGFAMATASIAAVFPSFPAATLGSLYVGIPHAHAHPPSLIPPAPPVPLPSIGAVTLGTCVQVLIGGMPAARAGDLGLAPTCCGFAPFFEVFLGSSKVFIGGARAARLTDISMACTKTTTGPLRGLARAMSMAGKAVAMAGIIADATDAATATDSSMAEAQAIAAGMGAAQMAADAIATAASAAMGTDPGIPPAMPGPLMTGVPKVLIGGFPMPTLPDPAQWLFNKLKGLRKKRNGNHDDGKSSVGCKPCQQ
jgi:uncharacterized Zn-binding protein involved in type VI secretion